MAFRTPTPLKSTDLQFGHCVENIAFVASFLPVSFCRTARTARLVASECRQSAAETTFAATVQVRAAGFAGSLNLFRRPQVGLGELHPLLCASNLALVPFC
jgi:hypothetical protein